MTVYRFTKIDDPEVSESCPDWSCPAWSCPAWSYTKVTFLFSDKIFFDTGRTELVPYITDSNRVNVIFITFNNDFFPLSVRVLLSRHYTYSLIFSIHTVSVIYFMRL